MSKGSDTTTTSQTPTALPAYQGAIGQLQNVAATPYTPYGGQLVSPVNEQQQTGIGNINQYAQAGVPYLQQAAGLQEGAANPLTAGQIQQYYSPYQQDVVGATEAQFNNQNAMQQQQVLGNAAAQGALGGDRTAVAQSVLAGQQQAQEAPVIAGLENQGYAQALQTAGQQFQQNPEQAAYGIASTGQGLETAALTGANAQVGAGTLEQQTQQAQDTAAYQQFMQSQFMPESMLSWELPLLTGVGSQEGGTGTTTGPAPNPWSQIIGAGIGAGAAVLSDKRAKENIRKIGKLFDGQNIYRFNYKGTPTTHVGLLAQEVEKDNPDAVHEFHNVKAVDLDAATRDAARRFGGRIQGLQGGGVPGAFSPGGANPWLNYAQMPGSTNTPKPPQLPGQQQTGLQSPQQMIANAAKIAPSLSSGIGNIFNTGTTELSSGMNAGDLSALTGEDADVSSAALAALPFGEKRGGRVPVRAGLGMASFMPRRRYASGGSDDSGDEDTVNFPSQRFVQPPMPAGLYNNSAGEANPLENILKFQTYGLNSPYAPAASTDETPRTAANDELPSEITRGASAVAPQSGIGVSAMSFADDGSRNAPSVAPPDSVNAGPAQAASAPVRSGITSERNFGLLGLLPQDVGVAALTAGLGMMASRSPFLGTAIGEGGLQGLSTYSGLKKQEQDVDLKVRQLDQAAKQESDRMALEAKKESDLYSKMTPAQQAEVEFRQRNLERENLQPVKLGTDAIGRDVYGVRDPSAPNGFRRIDINSFGPPVPMAQNAPATGAPQGAVPGSGEALPGGSFPTAAEGARDEDYLKTLAQTDPGTAALVKGIADYSRSPTQVGFRDRTQIMKMVSLYDPSYDAAFYPARAQAIKEFNAGGPSSPAGQILAGNTAIQHAAEMSDAAEKMRANPGMLQRIGAAGIPFASYAANALSNAAVRGTPAGAALADFVTARNHFAEEVTKFYAGSQGSEAERERALANLDQAKSLPELRAAIATEAQLMHDKVNGLQERWKVATGGPGGFSAALRQSMPDFPIVHKNSEDAFSRIQSRREGNGTQGGGGTRPTSPRDQQALVWANANPRDPRAAQIKQRLGVQ